MVELYHSKLQFIKNDKCENQMKFFSHISKFVLIKNNSNKKSKMIFTGNLQNIQRYDVEDKYSLFSEIWTKSFPLFLFPLNFKICFMKTYWYEHRPNAKCANTRSVNKNTIQK